MSKPSKRIINQLKKYGKDTPEISFKGLKTWARLCSVYDADTIKLILPLDGTKKYYKFSCRIDKLDACEMKSKNEKCKELAHKARDRLIELTGFKEDDPEDVCLLWVECKEMDKYFRVLVDVKKYESDPETFAEILKREKLAYQYTGGTKLSEEEQIELLS